MRWPWTKPAPLERRASYTDQRVDAAHEAAETTAVQVAATAAVEASAGIVGRAFAAATVEADRSVAEALTPALLGQLGRELIRSGQFIARVRFEDGLYLDPACDVDLTGSYDPATWRYKLELPGPSTTTSVTVPRDQVLHAMYAYRLAEPWAGVAPLQFAKLTGSLSAEVTAALGDEATSSVGSFLPLPVDGNDPSIATLKADIKGARGKVLTVESGDWDSASRPSAEWQSQRFGAAPPRSLVDLQKQAFHEAVAACGVPPSLATDAQGVAIREATRAFVFTTVEPLARMVEAEMRRALDAEVRLSFRGLHAADIQSRARAFASMIGRDVEKPLIPIADARRLAGLE